MTNHYGDHIRGHLGQLYAERRRHREEVAELKHQLHRANTQAVLVNQMLAGVQQQLRATADLGLSHQQEVIRLSSMVADLRRRLHEATAPKVVIVDWRDQGDNGNAKEGP